MKHLLLFTLLSFAAVSKAQNIYPTNRAVYNFSVGDTFVYDTYHYNPQCQCNFEVQYRVVVTGKSYSLGNDTVFYSYHGDYPLKTFYTNLDSAVILVPTAPPGCGCIDTAYTDSSTFCDPVLLGVNQTSGSLSENYNYQWAVGLGQVDDIYYAPAGDDHSNDHAIVLIYYNKQGFYCGHYNPSLLATDVLDVSKASQNIFYPNPVTQTLHISGDNNTQAFIIYDETGKVCLQGNYQNEIDLKELSPGIYLVKTTTDNNVAYAKIIKQ